MGRPSKYSPEVRDRAVRMVREHPAATTRSGRRSVRSRRRRVAPAETLRKWVRRAETDAGQRPGVTAERERIRELERRTSGLPEIGPGRANNGRPVTAWLCSDRSSATVQRGASRVDEWQKSQRSSSTRRRST
jgi:transposase